MASVTQMALDELRRRAESDLSRVVRQSLPNLAPENVEALVHELQVHQIEIQMQCYELQRAQVEAEESRDRYRELYESIPVGYLTIDASGRIYDMNPAAVRLLGLDQQKLLNNFFFFFFLSNGDVNAATLFCRRVLAQQEPGMQEFNMQRMDGARFRATVQAVPVAVGEGKGERLRIAFEDITSRKEVEERLERQQAELEANEDELRKLARLLITAQEEERKRIARELHDDHCQRVTTLIMETKLLAKVCKQRFPDIVSRLTVMGEKLRALLNDFRTISHNLLPRNLGDSLVGPVRDLVREFSERSGFEITFLERDVPANIPPDIMTTVFRLLQESLCNILKHAEAKHVAVTLGGTDTGIELVVADDGIGFDPVRARSAQKGVGIVGMRERVRPLGGAVKIISEPNQGTTIVFSIPLHELT